VANRDVIKNQSATRVTTSSTSYQDALTATGTPTNGSKDFWVFCSAVLDKNSTSSDVLGKLVDATGGADLCAWNIEPKASSDFVGVFGMAKWTSPGSPTSQSFKLQLATESSGAVGMDEMTLVAVESDPADQYVGTDGTTTTSSSSYVDAQTLTFTPATQGDYLIVAYAEYNVNLGVQLSIDGTLSHVNFLADVSDTSNYQPWLAARVVTFTAASHTIKIQFKSQAVSVNLRRRRILAIRLDTLQSAYSSYTAARSASSVQADAATVTFTAVSSVDYLAIANTLLDTSLGSAAVNGRLSLDGSTFGAAARALQSTSATYQRMLTTIAYSSFAAGSRMVAEQVYPQSGSGASVGYAYSGVYVLDLRAPAGTDFIGSPGIGAASAAGQAVIAVIDVVAAAAMGSAAAAGQAAAVLTGSDYAGAPAIGSAAATGFGGAVLIDVAPAAAMGAASGSGQTVALAADQVHATQLGVAAALGQGASLTLDTIFSPSIGRGVAAGQPGAVVSDQVADAGQGIAVAAGQGTSLVADQVASPGTGVAVGLGLSARMVADLVIEATAGTADASGLPAIVLAERGVVVTAGVGSAIASGFAAGLGLDQILAAAIGAAEADGSLALLDVSAIDEILAEIQFELAVSSQATVVPAVTAVVDLSEAVGSAARVASVLDAEVRVAPAVVH
jgi:hypothetical protein